MITLTARYLFNPMSTEHLPSKQAGIMAYHRKLVLPAFKVTKRSTAGDIVEKDVPRGFKSKEEEPFHPEDTAELSTGGEDGIDFNSWATESSPGPGLYEISQKASVSAWESIRKCVLKAVTESNAMPKNQLCTCCCEVLATFRCIQCGPHVYFCASCLPKQHLKSNIFHIPEQWKVCSECELYVLAFPVYLLVRTCCFSCLSFGPYLFETTPLYRMVLMFQ